MYTVVTIIKCSKIGTVWGGGGLFYKIITREYNNVCWDENDELIICHWFST